MILIIAGQDSIEVLAPGQFHAGVSGHLGLCISSFFVDQPKTSNMDVTNIHYK